MTSIMEKNNFYILSVNYIISTQYQLLVSSAPPTSPLSTLSFSSNYYRRSTTYWVFWYYGDSGDRQCGNYCIIVFSIVAFLLLCIILCGCLKCYFIRQRYKEDEKYTGDSSIENTLAAIWPDQARKEQEEAAELQKKKLNEQYPPLKSSSSSTTASPSSPLSSNHDNNPPPAYGDESVGDEPNFFHNLRRRSPFQAVRHANKFSKDHPPFEALPPTDHMNFLKVTGINAWKFSSDNLIRANIISMLNDRGNKIRFNLKLDAMVQTNYPLIKLYEFNENTNENSNNNEDYDNNSSNSSSNSNNNVVHKIVPKPSQAHLLSNDGQHQDLSLAPPPYESPSTSALGKPGKWFYYYEVTILSNPNKKDTTIAIGLATKPYPNYRLPGWSIHSVGYHSNNGNKFHNESFAGREYGEKWGDEGDTIGCGYYPNTGYVFFTKNGKFQEIAFTGLFHIWFPTIGTDGECNMEINFGNNNNGKEFVYQEATGMSVCGPINNKIISNENEIYISKDEKNDNNL